MKLKNKTIAIAVIIGLIPLVLYGLCYDQLPEQVVTNFDFAGNPQGYTSRDSMCMMLLLPLGLVATFVVVPRIDPRGKNYEKLGGFYPAFVLGMMGFISLMCSAILISGASGVALPMEKVTPGAVGLLFLVIGNYMPKMKHSYTMGIKTPWTLDSEVVWNKTHRLAGPCFMVAGLVMLLSLLLPSSWGFALVMISILVAGGIPSVMSYVYYRQ